ncbi:phosphatase 2C-like domain-containing protein, partial [Pavlovales sp. CCMP2436]
GTTSTCVIVDGDEVTTANVGDSTAILYAQDETIILSADHRVERRTPAEHDRLMKAGAAIGRIRGRNGLPVGPERIYPGGDSTAAAIPLPEVRTITLPASGGMIVIASDGVWDFVSQTHIEKLAQK